MGAQVTLFQAVEAYVDLRRTQCAHATVINESSALWRFARSVGNIQVRHLGQHHAEAWFTGRSGLPRTLTKPASFNYNRRRLSLFFKYCAAKGWLRSDPLTNIRAQPIPRTERLRLAPDQLLALLDTPASPRDRAFLAVAINTAARAGEITGLLVGDVDLAGGNLLLRITKTDEEDLMPITADLDAELRSWLTIYATGLGSPLTPAARLFPAYSGPRWAYSTGAEGEKVKRTIAGTWRPTEPLQGPAGIVHSALRALGYPTKGEGVHTIRRSVARYYFDSRAADGYDSALRATSSLLHHRNSATTETYLGLSQEKRRRDETMRGRPFLSAAVDSGKVRPILGSVPASA